MNDSIKTKMIKYLSIGAIIIIVATLLWNILKPRSQSFLIIDKTIYSTLNSTQKAEIDSITVNSNYSCSNANCTIQIDLNKITPLTDIKVDSFLRKYSKIFCYEESYQFIEASHNVDEKDTNRRKAIENGTKNTETLDVFVKGIDLTLTKGKFYGNYINFYIDSTDNLLKHRLTNAYQSKDMSISEPTIRSIISINGIDKTKLKKYEVTYSLFDSKHIGLIIEEKNNPNFKKLYYNYSTDPNNPGSTIMLNPFFSLY